MVLTNGARLGFYEIVAPLGAGGMGEVYRARDTKLDREVAKPSETASPEPFGLVIVLNWLHDLQRLAVQ